MARVALIILLNSRQLIYQEKSCVISNILQLTYNVPCSKSLATHCLWGSDAPFMQVVFSTSKIQKKHDFTLEKKLSKAQERNLQLEGADITTPHRKRPDQHVLSKCWSYSLQTRVEQNLTEVLNLETIFRSTNRPSDIDYSMLPW